METTKSFLFPLKVKSGTVAVQISPSMPLMLAGEAFVLFHIQWKEQEGQEYKSTDLLLPKIADDEKESFLLEEAATEKTKSFSGSDRPYYKAVRNEDGKWLFGAEGMPGNKLIAVEEE